MRQKYGDRSGQLNVLVAPQITQIKEKEVTRKYSPWGSKFKIRGHGFTWRRKYLTVKVGTQNCRVRYSSKNLIKCLLKPYNDTQNDVAFVGGRGLKRETFRGKFDNFEAISGQSADEVTHMNQLAIMGRKADKPKVESGAKQDRVVVYKGLFKAPASGHYKFLLSSQGWAQFWMAHDEEFSGQIKANEYATELLINSTGTPKTDPYQKNTISKLVKL